MEFVLCVSGRGNSDLRLPPGITSEFGQVLLALMPGAKAAQAGGGDATAASACGHAPTPGKGAKRHCSSAGTGTGSLLVTLLGHFLFLHQNGWENGRKVSCLIWGKDLVPASTGIVYGATVLFGCALR